MKNKEIENALKAWDEGKLVAIPTETVYGLGAPVNRIELVKQIFALKERPFFDPLIVHISDMEMAKRYTKEWNEYHDQLASRFWPGPMTIVVPKSDKIDPLITSGLETVGLRIPRNELTLELIRRLDAGVAAPSANKFTKTSPTCARHVWDQFSANDLFVLEDDPSDVGIESTIISLNTMNKIVTILRPGILTAHDFMECLGQDFKVEYGKTAFETNQGHQLNEVKVEAPGQFKAHYRPDYPLAFQTMKFSLDQYKLDYPDVEFIPLSSDPYITARALYSFMRTSLTNGFNKKCFLIPDEVIQLSPKEKEVWEGILNRLSKASTFTLS